MNIYAWLETVQQWNPGSRAHEEFRNLILGIPMKGGSCDMLRTFASIDGTVHSGTGRWFAEQIRAPEHYVPNEQFGKLTSKTEPKVRDWWDVVRPTSDSGVSKNATKSAYRRTNPIRSKVLKSLRRFNGDAEARVRYVNADIPLNLHYARDRAFNVSLRDMKDKRGKDVLYASFRSEENDIIPLLPSRTTFTMEDVITGNPVNEIRKDYDEGTEFVIFSTEFINHVRSHFDEVDEFIYLNCGQVYKEAQARAVEAMQSVDQIKETVSATMQEGTVGKIIKQKKLNILFNLLEYTCQEFRTDMLEGSFIQNVEYVVDDFNHLVGNCVGPKDDADMMGVENILTWGHYIAVNTSEVRKFLEEYHSYSGDGLGWWFYMIGPGFYDLIDEAMKEKKATGESLGSILNHLKQNYNIENFTASDVYDCIKETSAYNDWSSPSPGELDNVGVPKQQYTFTYFPNNTGIVHQQKNMSNGSSIASVKHSPVWQFQDETPHLIAMDQPPAAKNSNIQMLAKQSNKRARDWQFEDETNKYYRKVPRKGE